MGRNFNVVFPLADLCLGTLMVHDPLRPRRTEPAAREVARRHSRYGRKLAAEAEAAAEGDAGVSTASTKPETSAPIAALQELAAHAAPSPVETAPGS